MTDDEKMILREAASCPAAFDSKHTDPILYGKCQCAPCWYERAAIRKAEQAERATKRDIRAALWRDVSGSDGWMALIWIAFLGGGGFAVWVLGSIVYVWLYGRGLK